ncbi:MAG: hypothetical protein BGO10_01640 [Chlamydia sp. 32-24]|nr:MAG: hypothetical protein BGO10_01640 [Chlamydia sp. 32-24]
MVSLISNQYNNNLQPTFEVALEAEIKKASSNLESLKIVKRRKKITSEKIENILKFHFPKELFFELEELFKKKRIFTSALKEFHDEVFVICSTNNVELIDEQLKLLDPINKQKFLFSLCLTELLICGDEGKSKILEKVFSEINNLCLLKEFTAVSYELKTYFLFLVYLKCSICKNVEFTKTISKQLNNFANDLCREIKTTQNMSRKRMSVTAFEKMLLLTARFSIEEVYDVCFDLLLSLNEKDLLKHLLALPNSIDESYFINLKNNILNNQNFIIPKDEFKKYLSFTFDQETSFINKDKYLIHLQTLNEKEELRRIKVLFSCEDNCKAQELLENPLMYFLSSTIQDKYPICEDAKEIIRLCLEFDDRFTEAKLIESFDLWQLKVEDEATNWEKWFEFLKNVLDFLERFPTHKENEFQINPAKLIVASVIQQKLLFLETISQFNSKQVKSFGKYGQAEQILIRFLDVYLLAQLHQLENLASTTISAIIDFLNQFTGRKPKEQFLRYALYLSCKDNAFRVQTAILDYLVRNDYMKEFLKIVKGTRINNHDFYNYVKCLNGVDLGQITDINDVKRTFSADLIPFSTIRLENCTINKKKGITILEAIKNVYTSLRPDNYNLRESPTQKIGAGNSNIRPAFKHLILKKVKLPEGFVKSLTETLKLPTAKIEVLNFDETKLTTEEIKSIFEVLEHSQTLMLLKLTKNVLNAPLLGSLNSSLMTNKTLKFISLQNANLDEVLVKKLFSSLINSNSALEYIDLGHNKIKIIDRLLLRLVNALPNLQVLDVSYNQITTDQILNFANGVAIQRDFKLVFTGNKVDQTALKNSSFTYLESDALVKEKELVTSYLSGGIETGAETVKEVLTSDTAIQVYKTSAMIILMVLFILKPTPVA